MLLYNVGGTMLFLGVCSFQIFSPFIIHALFLLCTASEIPRAIQKYSLALLLLQYSQLLIE